MSKEHHEFDEIYSWLLQYGNRKELSRYRNFIIDELEARGEIRHNLGSEKQEIGLFAWVARLLNIFHLKEKEKITQKPKGQSSNARFLSKESTEILKRKKEIIDQRLGW